jgi:hypothetical protein
MLGQYMLTTSTNKMVFWQELSKQNRVKGKRRTSLNLETLDALMRAFLNSVEVDSIDWNSIYDTC